MYEQFEKWVDKYLQKGFPEDVIAAIFNIYEDSDDYWSIEIVGTGSFEEDDEDWACDEVTDLGSREELFSLEAAENWKVILDKVAEMIKEYLIKGKYANSLKKLTAVGTGFVDGNIEILYKK